MGEQSLVALPQVVAGVTHFFGAGTTGQEVLLMKGGGGGGVKGRV